jgi:hypothetical protein
MLLEVQRLEFAAVKTGVGMVAVATRVKRMAKTASGHEALSCSGRCGLGKSLSRSLLRRLMV